MTADLLPRLQSALGAQYAVERELGRGGMAAVYLARDLRHARPVALKVLHPELAAVIGAERFLTEIRVTANLQHPHILPLFDSGHSEELLYYVMPFVAGESLRARLVRETQLPVEDAVRIAKEVASALDYAHRQGVVHRDIKPENILLHDGTALVADFGIALAVTRAGGNRLTQTGLSLGTPHYMSPEQAAGDRELDGRSDVYALGATLYEMLVGEPPFTGPTAQAIIAKRFRDEPPRARQARPNVPESVDLAIARSLATVPADRWSTAAEFAHALTPIAVTPATETRAVVPPPARRPSTALAFVLGLAVMASTGMLVWRRSTGPSSPAVEGPHRLAVLPFETRGDSAEIYFADGITDEVRGKLAALPGLQVTASNSSNHYKRSAETPEAIARELGVQYLLVGQVRWETRADGRKHVRVSPELVEVASGSVRWQQPFDAALTDVFEVQGDIAARVAGALDVVLNPAQRQTLAARPTTSLAAWDAALKADEVSQHLSTTEQDRLERAVSLYRQAVGLDSTFAQAWGRLSRTYSLLCTNIKLSPECAEPAKQALDRAVALAPGTPETQMALGDYYTEVADDQPRSLAEYEAGLRVAPESAELLAGATIPEQVLGHFESSLSRLEHAVALDPRTVWITRNHAYTLLMLRRYADARAAVGRGLALAPDNLALVSIAVDIALGEGDTARARSILRNVPPSVAPEALVAGIAVLYDPHHWLLDEQQQRLVLRLGPERFGGERAVWAIVRAQLYASRGDRRTSLSYADTARLEFQAYLRHAPQDAGRRVMLGLALAYLGRYPEAIATAQQALAANRRPIDDPYFRHQLVRIYLMAGDDDRALDGLESLLAVPYTLSPGRLRVDPGFAALRNSVRFRRLLGGTS